MLKVRGVKAFSSEKPHAGPLIPVPNRKNASKQFSPSGTNSSLGVLYSFPHTAKSRQQTIFLQQFTVHKGRGFFQTLVPRDTCFPCRQPQGGNHLASLELLCPAGVRLFLTSQHCACVMSHPEPNCLPNDAKPNPNPPPPNPFPKPNPTKCCKPNPAEQP